MKNWLRLLLLPLDIAKILKKTKKTIKEERESWLYSILRETRFIGDDEVIEPNTELDPLKEHILGEMTPYQLRLYTLWQWFCVRAADSEDDIFAPQAAGALREIFWTEIFSVFSSECPPGTNFGVRKGRKIIKYVFSDLAPKHDQIFIGVERFRPSQN